MEIAVRLIALAIAIIIHEMAHGYAAYLLGDPTAKNAGRLSFNPLVHIDPFGSLLLPIMLVLTHSPVLLGWAKPVPFNPAYFKDTKRGIMYVGAAGPISNLILAEKYLGLERFGFIIIFGLLYLNVLDFIIGPIAGGLLNFLLK